jgi:hypothetical protein
VTRCSIGSTGAAADAPAISARGADATATAAVEVGGTAAAAGYCQNGVNRDGAVVGLDHETAAAAAASTGRASALTAGDDLKFRSGFQIDIPSDGSAEAARRGG